MKKHVLSFLATLAMGAGLFNTPIADAACSSWGTSATTAGKNATCSCGSASGTASFVLSTSSSPGYGAGRINSGNNSTNDIQIYVVCHADSGTTQGTYYSVWDDGNYVYRGCPSSLPHPVKVNCRIQS